MKISEIENTLPNGFHDSILKGITVNYLSRTAAFEIDVMMENGSSKAGKLGIEGMFFLSIDPPATGYPYAKEKGHWITSSDAPVKSALEQVPKDLPQGIFTHCFFIDDWNSFIVFAAKNATFEWL
jgi:hypothetical protein